MFVTVLSVQITTNIKTVLYVYMRALMSLLDHNMWYIKTEKNTLSGVLQ